MISTLTKKHPFDMVLDAQKVFRLLLEAVSNPGRTVSIQEYAQKITGSHPALLAAAVTLLDPEVGFHAPGDGALQAEIASLTLSRRAHIDTADFVFARGREEMEAALGNCKYGTPDDPHKSAVVIVLNDGNALCRCTLSGPGINGTMRVSVTQLVRAAVRMRDALHLEYPQGIDLLFISSGGDVMALPRLVRVVG